jgi:AraC family transcriptional regulator
LNLRIHERPARRIAFMRHVGPYGAEVAAFWNAQVVPWLVREGLLGRPRYGISLDDPGVVPPQRCRYDAGVEVGDDYLGGGPVQVTALPAGRYAGLAFRGTATQVPAAWAALLHEAAATSNLRIDVRPCFEYYPADSAYDPATGVFACEIVIPVAPL